MHTRCEPQNEREIRGFRYLAAQLVLLVGLAALIACGSSKNQCDNASCAAGNTCIEEKGDNKCRRLCQTQNDATTGCPFNYTCVTRAAGDYCSLNAVVLAAAPKGQWGAHCDPLRGRDANVDCDIDQEFRCFGDGTKDANAYCTRYDCTADRDCAGGYFCATVNKYPDVSTDTRSVSQTIRVCKRRSYCDMCQSDVDCPLIANRTSHCIADKNGAHYCTQECDGDTGCNNEARCTPVTDAINKVCVPRAAVCVGDGSICSPCKSDKDCPQGLCQKTEYSTERFCSRKSGRVCGASDEGDCPTSVGGAKSAGCFTSDEPQWKGGQCVGFYTIGEDTIAGCFTPSR